MVKRIVDFLSEIGIKVGFGEVPEGSFLPGIDVVDGGLVVDESRLRYPGDLLHEAGHLAVSPAVIRPGLQGTIEIKDAIPPVVEAAAMSWSYAACIHLGLDPQVVFHEAGYHGQSQSLLMNFRLGVVPGLPELETAGMTLSKAEANRQGQPAFPAMIRWLRQ